MLILSDFIYFSIFCGSVDDLISDKEAGAGMKSCLQWPMESWGGRNADLTMPSTSVQQLQVNSIFTTPLSSIFNFPGTWLLFQ